MRCVGGLQAAHHLDKLHHRHRIEEVQPNEPAGIGDARGKPGDGNRGCVRADDGIGPHRLIHGLEDFFFDVRVFGRGLNDKIGRREGAVVCARCDEAECCLLGSRAHLSLRDQPVVT